MNGGHAGADGRATVFDEMFADAVRASARDVARPLVACIGQAVAAAPPELRFAIAADLLSTTLAATLAAMQPEARDGFRLYVEHWTEAGLAHADAYFAARRTSDQS